MARRSEFILRTTILTLGLTLGGSTYAQPGDGILGLDSDGDGRVSRDEFRIPEKRKGPPSMVARADADGNGTVTRAEIGAAFAEESDKRRDRMLRRFDSMDADGNGAVTSEEIAGAVFSRVDSDGDGFVTEAESEAMRDVRAARKKGGKGKNRDSEA